MSRESDKPAQDYGPVAIVGANGFVGTHLTRFLSARGWRVRALLRQEVMSRGPGVDSHVVDTRNVDSLALALDGAFSVINAAGKAHARLDVPGFYDEANIALPLRVAEAANSSNVARYIHLSSAHARFAEEDFDKTLPYGRSKLAAEQALTKFAESHRRPMVISLRPPVIHGPGALGNVALLDRLAARGVPLPFGAIQAKRSYLSIGNLCGAIETCLAAPDEHWKPANGQKFEICDGPPVPIAMFYKTLAAAHGRTVRCPPVPPALLRLMLQVIGKGRMANGLLAPLILSNDRLTSAFSWTPQSASG